MTTENMLKDQVLHIAKCIESGDWGNGESLNYDGEPVSALDYLNDVLDINYIINSDKSYKGARVLVAFGGPNIWINTRTKQVEGHWWGDSCTMSYRRDEMGIDDAVGELWACR